MGPGAFPHSEDNFRIGCRKGGIADFAADQRVRVVTALSGIVDHSIVPATGFHRCLAEDALDFDRILFSLHANFPLARLRWVMDQLNAVLPEHSNARS